MIPPHPLALPRRRFRAAAPQCLVVLDKLMRKKDARDFFNEPVDPVKFNLPVRASSGARLASPSAPSAPRGRAILKRRCARPWW